MTPLSAQEEAVLLLARYRGVVSEESLRAALVMARQHGQQFLNSLTGSGALSAGQAGDLTAALQEVRFACGNGCPELSYDELAGAFGLACPRCRMALRPRGPGIGRERASARLARRPGEAVARRSLGPYTLLSTLGRGSYGVVYLAQHPARDRLVAVKVLLDPGDESLRARFQLEAKIAQRLDHPGIVPVVDSGRDAGHDYYAMEYCAGQTLRERIRQGPLPAVEAAGLIAQIARAVHYAHEQGVLHRDLKPANVILAKGSGRPRLTDFGLARDPSLRMSLTATGEILGSPAYMAPEQIRGERDLDARADVYALGVSLYQCLAGRLPFEAANAAQMADRVLEGDAPWIGDVPGELEGICRRAMALEREDRHPSALALAETLERFCGTGRAPEPLTAQAERLVRPDARPFVPPAAVELSEAGSRWTAPVIGISAVLLPVFLYLALFPPGRQARQPEPEVVVSPAPLPPHSGSGFEPGPGPSPSQPAHLLRRETLDRLDALAIDVFRVDKRHALDPQPLRALARRLVTALDEYPDDPRLQTLQLYVELWRGKRGPFEVHRRWRELARQSPGLTQAEIGIVARLAHELGFQRAASDLLDQALPTLREPWLGVTALQMKVGAAWPVQDLERALLIADETLGLLERRDVLTAEQAHPTGYEVHGNRGLLRLYARDRAGAVADFRQAMALASDYDSRRIYEHGLAAIQRGEFTPDNALQ